MFGLISIIMLLFIVLLYIGYEFLSLQRDFNLRIAEYKETELKRQMDTYKIKCDQDVEAVKASSQQHIEKVTQEFSQLAIKEAKTIAEKWKVENEEATRKDAIQKSQAVSMGKMTEHLLPYFPDFKWNPKDARFLGSPIDLVVFDGLSEGQLKQIIFVEIKTNKSQLSGREKQIRDIVNTGLVTWEEIRHMINESVKP